MESLFGYAPTDKNTSERAKASSSFELQPQYIQIIDPRKAQNLSILLRALNVTTEEVCDALKEGDALSLSLPPSPTIQPAANKENNKHLGLRQIILHLHFQISL